MKSSSSLLQLPAISICLCPQNFTKLFPIELTALSFFVSQLSGSLSYTPQTPPIENRGSVVWAYSELHRLHRVALGHHQSAPRRESQTQWWSSPIPSSPHCPVPATPGAPGCICGLPVPDPSHNWNRAPCRLGNWLFSLWVIFSRSIRLAYISTSFPFYCQHSSVGIILLWGIYSSWMAVYHGGHHPGHPLPGLPIVSTLGLL